MSDLDRYNTVIRNIYGRAYEQGSGVQANKDSYITRTLSTDLEAARYTTGYATEVLRDRPRYYYKYDSPNDSVTRRMGSHGYVALAGSEGLVGVDIASTTSLLKDSLGDAALTVRTALNPFV